MRRANGEGSITPLKGKRRKKYWARVTAGYIYSQEKDQVVQSLKSLGVHRTISEAQKAIDYFLENPFQVLNKDMTMDEAFQKLIEIVAVDNDKYAKDLEYKWRYCEEIKSLKLVDLKTVHLKRFLDGDLYYIKDNGEKVKASSNTIMRIKSILNQIYDMALAEGITIVNYARNFQINKKVKNLYNLQKKDHIPFTNDEFHIIENNLNYPFMDMLYIQVYMGWRPEELVEIQTKDVHIDEQYIVGGKKTENGYRRTVPIHPKIIDLIKTRYLEALELESDFLFNDPNIKHRTTSQKFLSYSNYRYRFNKIINHFHLNAAHTPHDLRKTFSTRAKLAEVDMYAIKKFMGHSVKNDVTEECYIDPDFTWYRKQMNKLD